jgi:hypothetical protein
MALKGDRVVLETDITLTCDYVTDRGVVVVYGKNGSGIALGSSAGDTTVKANPSGQKVAGLLMNDIVNVDETRYHRNFHKDEKLVNERVTLLKKGRVTTNKVVGTPSVGDTAYLDSSGCLIPTLHATGGIVARPKVGQFVSIKDENGYVAVDINLPVV